MIVKNSSADLDVARHQLSFADFESLARGAAGAGVTRRLRSTERSRRLVLLRALMDSVAGRPELYGPLPDPEDAWSLLAKVQERTPEAFETIIGHPYTGAWVAHAKRLVDGVATEPNGPMWIHVGHLHALAAAAAIRGGFEFEARVPVRGGEVILPTLGTALLPAAPQWAIADVHADAGSVRVSGSGGKVVLPKDRSEDAPGWWGIRHLLSGSLEVRLDDLDPYRDLHEVVPAERLAAKEVKDWEQLLDEAWQLIAECVPEFAEGFQAGFDSLVPRPAVDYRYLSGSTSETFGSAVVARPADGKMLASALVHEFQHSTLHGLMHLTRLHEDDQVQRFYTLWRDDPRPLPGTIHGIYAFFGMTGFWRALAKRRNEPRAWFEYAYCRIGTWRTLTDVRVDPNLTDHGRRFLDGVEERLEGWRAEAIPDGVASLAECAAADHHAGWRLRYVRPDAGIVTRLAEGLPSGEPTPSIPRESQMPVSEADGEWTGARTELVRLRLDDAERFGEVWREVPGATEADFDYVSGDSVRAIAGYKSELESDPDSVTAWAGLGLALAAHQPDGAAARALRECPELVRAVHREVRAARVLDPEELAAWIGGLDR
jgi:HEXXH motif-containing protein